MGMVKRAGLVIAERYRLDQPLGSGAMGMVWAALDLVTAQRVAVKFAAEQSSDLRARFVREAKLSKRLSHPNIVTTLDVGETNDGEPFLVQECLTGPTLAEKLKTEKSLDAREAARIVRDIALGVEAAHAAEIIHRDLKPANVMLHDATGRGTEFVVKVLDFGIAKSVGSANQTYATVVGMALGSPAYMSPEGLIGRGVDHRTDIWALGIILYELIVGKRPFVGSQTEVANQVLVGDTPSVCERVRGVPDEIDRIVMLCLQKSRDKRLSSASELVSILTQLIESPRVWPSKPVQKDKPADADGDKTLLWRPPGGPVLPDAMSEPTERPLEGVETVVRDAPGITSTSRRRRELRMIVGVAVGVVVGVVGMLVLGLVLGWFSNESRVPVEVGPTEPSATPHASTNAFEDKLVSVVPSATNSALVPSATPVVPSAKPVVPVPRKKVEKKIVVPF
ncbi:MAG: serine/threonine protein kinase [Polyangiaceae bacterium]|nr:serine/threonine protein kinase [Polyangiaceae bacterium]